MILLQVFSYIKTFGLIDGIKKCWSFHKYERACYQDPQIALDFAAFIRKQLERENEATDPKAFRKLSISIAERAENWYCQHAGKSLPRDHVMIIRKY